MDGGSGMAMSPVVLNSVIIIIVEGSMHMLPATSRFISSILHLISSLYSRALLDRDAPQLELAVAIVSTKLYPWSQI